jgi:hypothetical protein
MTKLEYYDCCVMGKRFLAKYSRILPTSYLYSNIPDLNYLKVGDRQDFKEKRISRFFLKIGVTIKNPIYITIIHSNDIEKISSNVIEIRDHAY